MKTTISETIDGSMKDVLQLKTLDRSLEYSQLFDALEDCPNDFKSKLIGALNSLAETMGIPATDVFNKVLCASDDENAKKKMYNWWRAVFEVISKSVPNIPEERRQEYEDKLDALVAEICKAGDKASGNDVVLEEYEPASIEDEDKLKESMNFAISKIGEVAKKVEELVNFLNPYCGTEVNESTMDENEVREFVKAIGFRPDDDGHDYETQLVDALTGKDTSYNAGWGAVYYNSDKVLQFLKKFGMLGSRGIKQKEAISKLRRLFKSGKWKAQETTFENEVKTMKKMIERGGADEWIPANELAGKLYGEEDDGDAFWKAIDDTDDLENELDIGDDGWKEIGEPVPVKEATVEVDANDVWDVLDLLDDQIANKNLTDLINSHVRTEAEIMDAIEELSSGRISKSELNNLLGGRMVSIVSYLGLDEDAYTDRDEFVDSEKPVTLEGSDDEQKPDEVKGAEKKYKKDGETKTLDFGENKKVVNEMTISQDIQHAYQLVSLLWGNAKYYLEKLLTTKEFSGEAGDEEVLRAIEDMGITSLSQLNDVLSYEFETLLEALGCDLDAWNNGLEIKRA